MSERVKHRKWAIVAVAVTVIAASCAAGPDEASPDGPDTVLPDTGVSEAEPVDAGSADANYLTGSSDYLFDQDTLHTFELTLSEEALAEIDADPTAERYVEGSLTFEGETISPVGIRYKGSVGAFVFCVDGQNLFQPSGEKSCTKLSMKVKINWEDPDAEFFEVRRLQFHALNLDRTQMHERLGYWLFREMGVPAPRSVHARLMINGEYSGLYALTEQIDGRFTRENFEDGTGNLYKEVWPTTAAGLPQRDADFLSALKTNEDEDPSVEMIRSFASEIVDAGAEGAADVLEAWTDTRELTALAVVDRTIRNDDGPFHWYCQILGPGCAPHNFYWYEDPSERTLHLIPWDLDNAFENIMGDANPVTPIADGWGEVSEDCEPFASGAFGVVQRSAACDPVVAALVTFDDDFQRIRNEFLAGPFAAERVEAQLSAWETQIEEATREAADLHDDALDVDAWRAAVLGFRRALESARDS